MMPAIHWNFLFILLDDLSVGHNSQNSFCHRQVYYMSLRKPTATGEGAFIGNVPAKNTTRMRASFKPLRRGGSLCNSVCSES